jgi:ubiquinone/menaquinone biosynthesis C-methylase UbiE
MREYYDRRAPEYDDWYLGTGLYAGRDRPGWHEEVNRLAAVIAALPPTRTLDVGCGTGFLTRHLQGDVVALDQSKAMLDRARGHARNATLVRGDALDLPFPDRSFGRVFAAHFYGHLGVDDRSAFLHETQRVAPELVVVDSARNGSERAEELQERVLRDGSRWHVFKRWFNAEELATELGGGETLFAGRWFVGVQTLTS